MPQQVLDYPLPRRPSELCSIAFLRYGLFGFNTIFMLTGFVLTGFGVWTLIEKSSLAPLLSPMFIISVYSMVAVGGLVLVAAIIGCQGTHREQHCGLITYAVLLVIIMLVEAGTGVISYLVYTQMTQTTFNQQLTDQVIMKWGHVEKITNAVDNIQIKYKCCGSDYYTNWKLNPYIKELNTTTPDSCCITPVQNCGRIDHPSNLNRKGCIKFLEDDLSLNIVLIPALTLGFSIVQIMGIILSCALAKQVRRSKRFIRRKYNYEH